MTEFSLVIMCADLHTEFDFLDLCSTMLALLLLLGEFVFELSKICDTADGRIGSRGNFDQVETIRFCTANGLFGLENAKLLACGANNDTHFAGANAVVNTNECWINSASVRPLARNGNGRCAGVRNRR